MNSTLEVIRAKLFEIVPSIIYALFILFVGYLFSRIGQKWLARLLERTRVKEDLLLKSFFVRIFSGTIIVLSLLVALSEIGWNVQSFIAGLGITGIILGFGFKDTLSNFSAGVLLLIYRPFRAGERIEVEGSQGIVEELTIVNMQMTTDDGVRVIMPNSKVWGAKIINYSVSSTRRLETTLKVPKEKIEDAIRLIKSSWALDKRILSAPEPEVRVTTISADSATLVIWVWTSTENHSGVAADQYLKLQTALSREQIAIL